MRILKKINNNFAVCQDMNGNEMIAYGKGIGFGSCPREISLAEIDRTYYNVEPQYYGVLSELPEELLLISTQIVDYAQQMYEQGMEGNMVFSLADHIAFAIKRQKENIKINFPFSYDVEHLYPKETKLAKYSLDLIRQKLKIWLPKQEIVGIALHFINNCPREQGYKENIEVEELIEDITKIVEKYFELSVNRNGFNYYRFACHLRYYIRRIGRDQQLTDSDHQLYLHMVREYPYVYECVCKVQTYLEDIFRTKCNTEEQLYLMIHIHRLCTNEDCSC